MKKTKNFIKNKKAIGIVITTLGIFVVIASIFFAITYNAEKQRYQQANAEATALITTEVQYELDNKEHELKVADFISSADEIIVTKSDRTLTGIAYNNEVVSKEDFVQVEREFVKCYDNQSFVFIADAVKTEQYLIETTIPDNKFYNEFKTIKTYIDVSCVDTTSPKWEKTVDKITIKQGDAVNVTDYFTATDLSGKVDISIDKEIDTNIVGTQTVNVFATDTNGCVANTTATVVVEKNIVNTDEKEKTTTNQPTQKVSASKSNTDTKTETKKQETTTKANASSKSQSATKKKTTTKKAETTTKKSTTCTNNNNHSIMCGNGGKWFNNKAECQEYATYIWNMWAEKLNNNEITREEYVKNSPYGYECWTCSYCGKWTINFKYTQ